MDEIYNKFNNSLNVIFILCLIIFSFIIFVIINIVKDNYYYKKYKNNKIATIKEKYPEIIQKYQYIIKNDIELNLLRKEQIKQSRISTIMLIVGALIFLIFPQLSIALILIGVLYNKKKTNVYNEKFKEKIIKNALKEYDNSLIYSQNEGIPEELYKISNFEEYDIYKSEDKINGTISNYNFVIADVLVQDERRDDGVYYVTLFNGVVAIITLPTIIDFELEIVNNRINSFDKDNKLEIDNPEFEEMYDVYTNNQLKAMMILSPAVTMKMLDLYKKYDFKFEFKLINKYMYFRFCTGDLFVSVPGNMEEEMIRIALYFEILDGIKEIMNEIIKIFEIEQKK